ncbi:MAG: SdiA-regulated domain-containing protein [Saprospiraceae bacterium]
MILNQLKIRFSKIYFYSAILLSSLFLLFSSCEAETTSAMDSIPFFYKINRPDTVQELPAELMEISGLSPFQKDKIACIQDEAGIIYIYDWAKREVVEKKNFQVLDDFEGVEIVDEDGFAITSEGDFYELSKLSEKAIKHSLNVNGSADFEGLCYDDANKQFLIVPKAELSRGKLFVFSYKIGQGAAVPLFKVSNKDVKKYCKANGLDFKLPKKDFPFAPSGIAIHPISKNIYIIASKGKTLCVFSPKGKILHLQNLDSNIYTQPEGIMFFENGDMMIASEGEEFGRLIRVNYLK